MVAFQADPRVSLEYCLGRSVAAVPVTEPEDAQLDYEDTIGVPVGQFALLSVSRLTPIQFPILTRCPTEAGVLSIERGLAAACSRPPAIGPGLWLHPTGLRASGPFRTQPGLPVPGLSQAW